MEWSKKPVDCWVSTEPWFLDVGKSTSDAQSPTSHLKSRFRSHCWLHPSNATTAATSPLYNPIAIMQQNVSTTKLDHTRNTRPHHTNKEEQHYIVATGAKARAQRRRQTLNTYMVAFPFPLTVAAVDTSTEVLERPDVGQNIQVESNNRRRAYFPQVQREQHNKTNLNLHAIRKKTLHIYKGMCSTS